MKIESTATNGQRCRHQRHRFRIGVDDRDVTTFQAGESNFLEALADALIDHVLNKRPGDPASGLYLQVWTTDAAGWRNVQNPASGAVIAVTHLIAGPAEVVHQLFGWACDTVQVVRDLEVLASGLAREAVEQAPVRLPGTPRARAASPS